MPGFVQTRLDQVEHRGELREQQDAPAFRDQLADHLQQIIELRGGFGTARADRSFTSRGSQQAWRSFSSASSTMIAALRQRALGHLLAHGLVQRAADGLVEFALVRRQGDAAQDGVLRRQFGRHLGLGAAQDEGLDALHQLRAADRVVVLLDRRAEALGEAAPVAEQARHQEGELRPQLVEIVLDRRAGQAEPVRACRAGTPRASPAHPGS